MKLNKTVQSQIESLTDNEDFRQDLWVAHLSGQHSLPSIFRTIQEQHQKMEDFQRRLHIYTTSEKSINIVQVLDNFDGIERQILYMIVLGYKICEIADFHGTSLVRVHQTINAIQKHNIWNKLLTSV